MSRFATVMNTLSRLTLGVTLLMATAASLIAQQMDNQDKDKHLDIRSSSGDMHVGNDADARDTGLPAYPGARLRRDDQEDGKNRANFSISTESFGIKMIVVDYDSDDPPSKVIAYYRDKLKRYGNVLECHASVHGGDIHVNAGKNNVNGSKEVKCEGDGTGNVVELKVGTEENQHLVAIEPARKGDGATFALVYVHTRGKQGEI
jgi:hypothetical protein